MWSKRINYISLLLLLALGLIFYHHYVLMVMIIMLLLAPVISFIVTKKCIDRFDISVNVQKTSVGKKVPVDVYFAVNNKTILPIEEVKLKVNIHNCFFENDEEYTIMAASIPLRTRTVKMTVAGEYCGRMIVEMKEAIIYDMFGLFRFRVQPDKSAEFSIMPSKKEEFESVTISDKGVSEDEELQMKKGDDVSQISQIRNYIPGDKLSNIHWKLSAKGEELQVKEYSMPYSEDVIILLELYVDKNYPDRFDELIEYFYAFAVSLIRQGRKFCVAWNADGSYELTEMEVMNEDDLEEVIGEIYYTEPETRNGLTYELFTSVNDNRKGTVLYFSDSDSLSENGERIDIGSEKVVITCLS